MLKKSNRNAVVVDVGQIYGNYMFAQFYHRDRIFARVAEC